MVERLAQTTSPQVLLDEISPQHIHEFLNPFTQYIQDLPYDFKLDISIRKTPKNKINPILRLANLGDAKIIAKIVKEDYEGTYPYKEMKDPEEIRRLMRSGKHKFFLFLDNSGKVMGSTCYVLDFEEKRGYVRSLVVRKSNHKYNSKCYVCNYSIKEALIIHHIIPLKYFTYISNDPYLKITSEFQENRKKPKIHSFLIFNFHSSPCFLLSHHLQLLSLLICMLQLVWIG